MQENKAKFKIAIIVVIVFTIFLILFIRSKNNVPVTDISTTNQSENTAQTYNEYNTIAQKAILFFDGIGVNMSISRERYNICDSWDKKVFCINVSQASFSTINNQGTSIYFVNKPINGHIYKIPVAGDQDSLQQYINGEWVFPKIEYYKNADNKILIRKLDKGINQKNIYAYENGDACTIQYNYFLDLNLSTKDFPYWLKITYENDTGCNDEVTGRTREFQMEMENIIKNMDIQFGEFKN